MANKKKNNKKRGFTFPQAAWAGMTAPYVMPVPPFGKSIGRMLVDGEIENAVKAWYHTFTGINEMGVFSFQNLVENYKPIAAGLGVHILASKAGVNRAIAQSGIPVLRI